MKGIKEKKYNIAGWRSGYLNWLITSRPWVQIPHLQPRDSLVGTSPLRVGAELDNYYLLPII